MKKTKGHLNLLLEINLILILFVFFEFLFWFLPQMKNTIKLLTNKIMIAKSHFYCHEKKT